MAKTWEYWQEQASYAREASQLYPHAVIGLQTKAENVGTGAIRIEGYDLMMDMCLEALREVGVPVIDLGGFPLSRGYLAQRWVVLGRVR